MKLAWLDVRNAGELGNTILVEPSEYNLDGIVFDDPEAIRNCLPNTTRIAFAQDQEQLEKFVGVADVITVDSSWADEIHQFKNKPNAPDVGIFVDVKDEKTLRTACDAVRSEKWTIIHFDDPTKIPLEIVLASGDNTNGKVITIVKDLEEAEIVLGVLEKGSHGVMLAPKNFNDAMQLASICHKPESVQLPLEELVITKITHIGMGERACVDTCSNFAPDEGVLLGSYSRGMFLVSSEVHPLPYMIPRPFRVNAGAIHSYIVSNASYTNYLSELGSGNKILAVNCEGKTREVVVGRMKIEIRPLLSIDAVSQSGSTVNVIVQDDWHVRVLGSGGKVLNVTELKPGDKVLGYTAPSGRHTGLPVKEHCLEK